MSRWSRRAFLVTLYASGPVLAAPRRAMATAAASRQLRFTHTHTSERLAVEYFTGGQYLQGALGTINHFLRDFRTNQVHAIDPVLLDLLHGMITLTGSTQPFQVISGYRSPATNELLRHRSEGVAAGSLHMTGQAIDVRLADVPLVAFRNAALAVRGGGVGYYPVPDFVHLDTGRVRRW